MKYPARFALRSPTFELGGERGGWTPRKILIFFKKEKNEKTINDTCVIDT